MQFPEALWAFVPEFSGLRAILLVLRDTGASSPAVSIEDTLELYWSGAGAFLGVECRSNGEVEWYFRDKVEGPDSRTGKEIGGEFCRLLTQYGTKHVVERRERSKLRHLKAFTHALVIRENLEVDRREQAQAVLDRLGARMDALALVTK